MRRLGRRSISRGTATVMSLVIIIALAACSREKAKEGHKTAVDAIANAFMG